MVFGYDEHREAHKRLILVRMGDKRALEFDSLPASHSEIRRISSNLKSHPGMAITLTGGHNQHGHGQE